MEVTYQRESVRQARESGIDALLEAHWHEIAHYPDIKLNPDVDAYLAAEDYGSLRVFTARADGELVGYAVFFVRKNIHYRDSLQAVQDILFLHPAHRRGRIGLQLVRFADEQLGAEGVQVVHQHVKHAHPALGTLLEHVGYERVETVYSRRLH